MSVFPYDDVMDEAPAMAVVSIVTAALPVAIIEEAKGGDPIREALEARARTYAAAVAAYVVTDIAEAHAFLKKIRTDRDAWKAYWAPHLEGALSAKRIAEANRKRVIDDIDRWDKPLSRNEDALDQKILAAEKAALEAAVAEQKRLQPIAEAEHTESVLATAVALFDEAEAQSIPEVREALVAEAEQILANPDPAPVVQVTAAIPTGTGVSRPKRYHAEIVSLTDLLTALVGKKLDAPLTVDLLKRIAEAIMPPLNQRASALKSALAIPGVKAVEDIGRRIR